MKFNVISGGRQQIQSSQCWTTQKGAMFYVISLLSLRLHNIGKNLHYDFFSVIYILQYEKNIGNFTKYIHCVIQQIYLYVGKIKVR